MQQTAFERPQWWYMKPVNLILPSAPTNQQIITTQLTDDVIPKSERVKSIVLAVIIGIANLALLLKWPGTFETAPVDILIAAIVFAAGNNDVLHFVLNLASTALLIAIAIGMWRNLNSRNNLLATTPTASTYVVQYVFEGMENRRLGERLRTYLAYSMVIPLNWVVPWTLMLSMFLLGITVGYVYLETYRVYESTTRAVQTASRFQHMYKLHLFAALLLGAFATW